MATITRPNSYVSNTTIEPSQVNDDLNTIYSEFNGSISNANIDASAAIVYSKLDSTTVTGVTATQTLTNKRITKRVSSEASSGTPTINTDNVDVHRITALAAAITSMTTNLSGTPNHDDSLIIEITDNGTARAITWGNKFESSGNVTLPTTTVVSTLLRVGFLYNSATSKWSCVAVA